MSDIISDEIRTKSWRGKIKFCEQCLCPITNGERYRRQARMDDGFYMYRAHEDCDAASRQLHTIAKLYPDEQYILAEYGDEDRAFLTEKYPGVAARMWPEKEETTP